MSFLAPIVAFGATARYSPAFRARTPASQLESVFASLVAQRVEALTVAAHVLFGGQLNGQLAELSLRHRLPAIFAFRDTAVAGGLMSYGGTAAEAFRQQGIYVARVLRVKSPPTCRCSR